MAYVVFGTVLTPELHSFLCLFIASRFFCCINLLRRSLLRRLAITFLFAITPYCKDFVVIVTIFPAVIDIFSWSVMCLYHVKHRHVNLLKKPTEHMIEYKIKLLKPTIV